MPEFMIMYRVFVVLSVFVFFIVGSPPVIAQNKSKDSAAAKKEEFGVNTAVSEGSSSSSSKKAVGISSQRPAKNQVLQDQNTSLPDPIKTQQLPAKKEQARVKPPAVDAAQPIQRPKLQAGWIKSALVDNNKENSDNSVMGKRKSTNSRENAIKQKGKELNTMLSIYNEKETISNLVYPVPIDFNSEMESNVSQNSADAAQAKKDASKKQIEKTYILNKLFAPKKHKSYSNKFGVRQFLSAGLGYKYNFYRSSESQLMDTPLKISLGNISASLVPINFVYGVYNSKYSMSGELGFTYYISNPSMFTKVVLDKAVYNGTPYVFSVGFKPQIIMQSFWVSGNVYFNDIIANGRDVYKLFLSIGAKFYQLQYSDRAKIVSSGLPSTNFSSTSTDLFNLPAYNEELYRNFEPIFMLGTDLGVGVTAKVSYNFIVTMSFSGEYSTPLKGEYSATLKNREGNSSLSIPWAKSPMAIKISPSMLIGLNLGVQYLF